MAGPAPSSPTIGQGLNGEYGWLEVNLHRRHLDTSPRAMIAADLATSRDGQHEAIPSTDAAAQADAAGLLKVILPHAVLQRFETSSSGVLVPVTEGSTTPTSVVVTNAGIATGRRVVGGSAGSGSRRSVSLGIAACNAAAPTRRFG
jgi:hypothetical protein